jgi:hypothetical protein
MIHARADYNRIQDPEGKIGEDEPVFLIRAKDLLAPVAMQFWADQAEKIGVQPIMVDMVRRHAELTKQWQTKNGCKKPDI